MASGLVNCDSNCAKLLVGVADGAGAGGGAAAGTGVDICGGGPENADGKNGRVGAGAGAGAGAGVDDDCVGDDTCRSRSAREGVGADGVGVWAGGTPAFARICAQLSVTFVGGKVGGACCCGEGRTGGGLVTGAA